MHLFVPTMRATRNADPNEAREAHRAAVVIALLLFLWGAFAILVVPWGPFWIPNVSQTAAGAGALLYLLVTWNRPQRAAADAITTAIVVYALLLLPWTAIAWCRLGRPIDAFTVPQLGIVSAALVLRGRWSLVIAVTSLFVLESVFPYVYAIHRGLGDMLPVNEPLATLGITVVGAGLLVLRRHRQQQARRYVRLRSEIHALDRMRPVLAHTIAELEEPLLKLQRDVPRAEQASTLSRSVVSALDRLGRLRGQLSNLALTSQLPAPSVDAERRYLDRDAQFGALVFASLMTAISAGTTLWAFEWLGPVGVLFCALKLALDLSILLRLIATRDRPSSRRAFWAVIVITFTAYPLVDVGQRNLLAIARPFIALLSLKLLMCMLGLTLTTRFRLGVILIAITAANAVALWFALDFGAHRDLIGTAEPYATLVFVLIAVISLRMLEQRKLASIQLLRAEAAASAAQRSAAILFALHDRLNSPLQTLTLAATAVIRDLPVPSSERVQQAIDRLTELSRELAGIDVLVPQNYPLHDANDELRGHA